MALPTMKTNPHHPRRSSSRKQKKNTDQTQTVPIQKKPSTLKILLQKIAREAEEERKRRTAWLVPYLGDDLFLNLVSRPSSYVSRTEYAQLSTKHEKFYREFPYWLDDLIDGFPSYFAIFRLTKKCTPEEVEEAYNRIM